MWGMPESTPWTAVIRRLEEHMEKRDVGVDYGSHIVRDHDIRALFELIRRYGGRKDWQPTQENIEKLPGPVRRYVRQLETEVQRWKGEAVRRRL